MRTSIRIPFRFKILATVLVLITTAVAIITFTMARMFHADKSAYVSDLAAVMAIHGADQAALVLGTHRDRMMELIAVLDDPTIPAGRKRDLLARLFSASGGCVAVRIFEGGREVGSLADTLLGDARAAARAALQCPLGESVRALAPGTIEVSAAPGDSTGRLVVLLVAGPRVESRPVTVVAAMLDTERSFALGGSGAFDLFLADAGGRVLWRSNAERAQSGRKLTAMPIIQRGSRAVVTEYKDGGVAMIGGFASVGVAGLVAGAQIPRSAALFASRELLQSLMWVALLLLLCAALVSMLWSAQLTRSLSQLAHAARQIGRGDFGAQVSVRSADEMGDLADSFNQMARELNVRELALREAQAQLVHSEKMAAFGQLGAGIAHEVKNPLAGILGIVQLSSRTLPSDHPIAGNLSMIEKETKRCRAIIDNLLRFARQEKTLKEPTRLGDVVADTVALMNHPMSLRNVQLEAEIEPTLPLIHANANQLQQVLMNLLLNAEQAMESRGNGTVTISARSTSDGGVELRVRDDGPGIAKATQARIFEPFFTTKPAGKGTGLGLSVSFGIVRDHGGDIEVESEEGHGTTFVIRLPEIQVGGDATEPRRTGGEGVDDRDAA
jgi:two-component system NtrC family sensor kinase